MLCRPPVLGLSLHQSSYISDVLDAGFRSVPREQSEAAWACGHNHRQIFLHVLLPQVGVIVLPPLASQFIEIVKNSAAAMLLGIKELTFQTQNIDVETFRGFEAATAVTLIYLALALTISGAMSLPWEPHQMAVRSSAFGPVEPTALDRWLWRAAVDRERCCCSSFCFASSAGRWLSPPGHSCSEAWASPGC